MENEAHVFKKKLKKKLKSNRRRIKITNAKLRVLFRNYFEATFRSTEAIRERDLKLFRLTCEIREEEREKQLACVKWLIEARENAEAICTKCIYNSTSDCCMLYDKQGNDACVKGIVEYFNNNH